MIQETEVLFVDYVIEQTTSKSYWLAHVLFDDDSGVIVRGNDRLGATVRLVDFLDRHPNRGRLARSVRIVTTI